MKFLALLSTLAAFAAAMPRDGDPPKPGEVAADESSTTSNIPTPTFFATSACFPTATFVFNTTSLWYSQSCTFFEHTRTITTTTYQSSCTTYTTSAIPTCDNKGVDGRC